MRVVSVNAALARAVPWRGGTVTTGIFKESVRGRRRITATGLAGDEQADLRVHGGPQKTVYLYPSEHYAAWRADLGSEDLPWGTFGENVTTEGLSEEVARVGDRYRVGTAILEATKPRFPCYKLGIRFGDSGIIPRFLASGRSGFYAAVLEEGDVGPGDPIERVPGGPRGPTIADLVRERIRRDEAGE